MKSKYCFAAILLASIFFVAARGTMKADEILGKWNYTVSNVPPEYESGSMTFEQKDEKVGGFIERSEKRQEMKELKIEEGKVSFKVDFEGGLIEYKMTMQDKKLNGTVLTNYGEFPIVAVPDTKE